MQEQPGWVRGQIFTVLFPFSDGSHLIEAGKAYSKTSPEYFVQGFEKLTPPSEKYS